MENLYPFGATFKYLREARGLSLKEAASDIVAPQFRSQFEKGDKGISLENFAKLLIVIGALENFKADNMKELVNLYDDTKYKELQLNYQKEMLQLQREQYIDTKKMLQALRYNNYVQTLQLQQLDGIRRNTEEAVDYLRNLRVQENHYHTHNHYHQNNIY